VTVVTKFLPLIIKVGSGEIQYLQHSYHFLQGAQAMPINHLFRFLISLTAAGIAAVLTACGGGGGSSTSTGSLSLGVTDLPTTGNEVVCIHFTSITLHHSEGDLIRIPYDPSTYYDEADGCQNNINPADGDATNNAVAVSALQGELSVQLSDTETVKAGFYNWIRLDVDETLSYVVDVEGPKDLRCPSCDGEQSGLKLNRGITVPAGGEANVIIDIELAKSLKKDPSGNYTLRPTLRLVDMAETGKIVGTVAESLIPEMISETDTGCKVYVYAGHGIVPDDYHDTDNVLTSAKVLYDAESTSFKYVAAFLPTDSEAGPTPYTVALTCDVDDMEIDQNNDPLNLTNVDDVIFTDGVVEGVGQETELVTGQTREVHFPPLEI
jgi:hypothetical protein